MNPPREMKPFLCHYHWDGRTWGVDIFAYDWEDAQARCKALGRLRLDGELIAKIAVPVPAVAAPLILRIARILFGR